jgi:hypothetical protein
VILAEDGDPEGYDLIRHVGPLKGFPADIGPIVAPFFYIDKKNTLFVEPRVTETTIEQGNGFTVLNPFYADVLDNADHWLEMDVAAQVPGPGPQEALGPTEIITAGNKYVMQKAKDWLTGPVAAVEFDGTAIGAEGGINKSVLKGMS